MLKRTIGTGLANEMMKCTDVLEIISPVTGSLCVPAEVCSEVIVLERAGKLWWSLERRGDLIAADSGRKKDVLYIYLQSPPLYQTLADYVTSQKFPFRSAQPLTRNLPKLSQTPTTCLRKYFRPRGGYIRLATVILRPYAPPPSSTCTTTSDSELPPVNAPFVQSVSAVMSSDYEYSDDDGDYYDEDELMDQDDQGKCRLTIPSCDAQ